MHIAQFIHRYPPALGGAEAYTARLCDYFAQHGDVVRVWTSTAIQLEEMWNAPSVSREQISDERAPYGRSKLIPSISRYRPIYFPARRYVLKALSLIPVRKWQCLTTPCNPICPSMWADVDTFDDPLDAVHAAAFPYSFPILSGLKLARRRGVPFFLTPFLHLGDPLNPQNHVRRQYTSPHLRWLLQQAEGVFVQTHLERRAAVDLGVKESRVFLQGLGVDPLECMGGNRSRRRAMLDIAPNEIVVGHLANNSFEKGTCDLLRAAEYLWASGLQFRIMLAGPEMPNFRTFWQNFPARNQVIQSGVLDDEGKRDFFSAIDFFALPSRTDSFGLVLLEAWANEKPNLVYRAGGPAELVRDEIDGIHARCGDIEELSIQLRRLVENEELRRRLGKNGRVRIAREFQWDDKLRMVRDVMERVILQSFMQRTPRMKMVRREKQLPAQVTHAEGLLPAEYNEVDVPRWP
jgi:glycosyltransferase involved in cell wall biosynthesis